MHVFISYSHDDVDFAQNVKHELERRKLPVWIDELTPAGDDWRTDIEDALRGSFALVLIMTPNAFESRYVTYEWAFALGANIPVIPILRKKTEFHPRLERLQHLDFTTSNRPWDDLAEGLQAVRDQRTPVTTGSLAESLHSRQSETRNAAIRMLRKLNTPDSIPLIESILFPSSPDQRFTSEVRKVAVDALGNMGDVGLEPLVRAMSHADRSVRFNTGPKIVALGTIAVPALLQLLDAGDVDVRVRTTWVLGEIGSPLAVEKLVGKLEDKDHMPTYRKRVCDGAADALIAIATADALDHAAVYWETQLVSKRKHWSGDSRVSDYAAEKLIHIDTPAARSALERWKRDQTPE